MNIDLINYINDRQEILAYCNYFATTNRPTIFNSNRFRLEIPELLNYQVTLHPSLSNIKIYENKGYPYDWIITINGKDYKISVKSLINGDIFPRLRKNKKGFTKGNPIIVKNFLGKKVALKSDAFDYLLLFIGNEKENIYSTYLYSMEQINAGSKSLNPTINFIPKSESDCLCKFTLSADKILELSSKFPSLSLSEREEIHKKNHLKAIKDLSTRNVSSLLLTLFDFTRYSQS